MPANEREYSETTGESSLTHGDAAQLARRAAAEIANIPPEVTPIVDERGDELVITFPTNLPVGVMGAHFHAQVVINKKSGVVARILGSS